MAPPLPSWQHLNLLGHFNWFGHLCGSLNRFFHPKNFTNKLCSLLNSQCFPPDSGRTSGVQRFWVLQLLCLVHLIAPKSYYSSSICIKDSLKGTYTIDTNRSSWVTWNTWSENEQTACGYPPPNYSCIVVAPVQLSWSCQLSIETKTISSTILYFCCKFGHFDSCRDWLAFGASFKWPWNGTAILVIRTGVNFLEKGET